MAITNIQPVQNPIAPEYTLGNLIGNIVGFFILIASILAFIYLLLGGIQWITSGGDKAAIEAARNRIIHAIVGLIIIASLWAIVGIIFPALGLSFPGFIIPDLGRGLETIPVN